MDIVIGDITPVSTTDFEGKSAVVVYFGLCNFKCPFCWTHKFLDTISCKKMDTKEVFDQVMESRDLISGVVFDGGEPVYQPDALLELCKAFKAEGLFVKINTNGSNSGIIAEILERNALDHLALDVKAPLEFEREYDKVIRVDAKKYIHEIERIYQLKHAFPFKLECRTTVVPHLIFRRHDIEQIAKEVSKVADFYVLQQFDPVKGTLDPEFAGFQKIPRERLLELARIAKRHVRDVRIRTDEMGEEKV